MTEQRMKVDDGPAPAESEEALKCMAHPARMRLLGALRVGGVQTVGELSAATGEAPGAVSYHLAQLAKVGLVEKAASPDGDKRKSYWKSCHHATNVQPDSADADVIDAFSRTAALTYQMAYERCPRCRRSGRRRAVRTTACCGSPRRRRARWWKTSTW